MLPSHLYTEASERIEDGNVDQHTFFVQPVTSRSRVFLADRCQQSFASSVSNPFLKAGLLFARGEVGRERADSK